MNKIKNILKERGLRPRGYEYKNKVIIVDTDKGKYVIKNKCNNYEVYDYLNAKGFCNYPKCFSNYHDDFDLSLYVEDTNIPTEQRCEDLIKTLSSLHNKTSYYQEIDLDEIKKVYEDTKNELLNLFAYYNGLNDYIDSEMFLSPANYLLVRNISLIYRMIDYSLHKIDIWYQLLSNEKKYRTCLIHNNISLDHLLIKDNNYLVSWNNSKIARPIYDIISFYKKYYKLISLEDVIKIYEHQNCISEEEKCLLLINLAIPRKITFTNNNLNDVIEINNEIFYLNKVYEYIKND